MHNSKHITGLLFLILGALYTGASVFANPTSNTCITVMKMYAQEIQQPALQLSKQCDDNPYPEEHWICMQKKMSQEQTFINATKQCFKENK